MKQCPQCQNVYPDEGLKFCGRDGSPLVDLSQTAGGFASLPVSPSEIVLLYGEQFASQPSGSLRVVVKVPLSGALVSAEQFALMAVSAAVLACEQAGSIHIHIGKSGGILARDSLYLSLGPMRKVRWQEWSLEHRLCGSLSQNQTHNLANLVTQLWQEDFKRRPAAAWIHARTLILQGLAARNLVSTSPDFSAVAVAPAITILPHSETTEPLRQLFSETAAQRQQLWSAIQKDINAGVGVRAQARSSMIDLTW